MAKIVIALSLLIPISVPTMAHASHGQHRAKKPDVWREQQPHRKPWVQPVVKEALKLRGIPYVWGGTTTRGFDCSGFTGYVLRRVGVHVGRDTYAQISVGWQVSNLRSARPGDLLFPSTGHVMLYLGRNRAIHSPHSGDVVHVVKATSRSYIAIRRPPGAWKKHRRPKPRRTPPNVYRNHVQMVR
jgi:cell wall-associated NlpC family hydrolase